MEMGSYARKWKGIQRLIATIFAPLRTRAERFVLEWCRKSVQKNGRDELTLLRFPFWRCCVKRNFFLLWIFALALFALPSRAFAKGPADQITITGPGLANPVVITDPQALAPFSPWSDQFFDPRHEILGRPSNDKSLYQVTIFEKDETGQLQRMYAFRYAPGAPGAIYLPGRGEAGYVENVSTILRDGLDGHWVRASQGWDSLMQQALAASGRTGAFSSLDEAGFGVALALVLVWIVFGHKRRSA